MAAHAFIQMIAPIYGSGGMRKTYALQYPGFLPYGKHWMMPNNARIPPLRVHGRGTSFRKHGYREFNLRFGRKTKQHPTLVPFPLELAESGADKDMNDSYRNQKLV